MSTVPGPTSAPVICFGQQPCGIFPRRFLYAKVQTARRLQREIGGRIVFFYHDSDHDPRETTTILRDRRTGAEVRLNFQCESKLQKQFSPLYRKRLCPGWQEKTGRQLPNYVDTALVTAFRTNRAENVADFCLQMYQAMGLIEGVEVRRSSDPEFRRQALSVEASGHVATGIVCSFTRVATLTWRFLGKPRTRWRSARRATAGCVGCNRSSVARTTSPARGNSNI